MSRIVILISGSGTNLQAFIDACNDGSLPCTIAAVISNKAEAFGLERARNAGIATQVVDHRQYDSRESFDTALCEAVNEHAPDAVILAGFMRILTSVFVGTFQGRLLNIHPSLLPKYPGLHTHKRAIEAGDNEAGATVHFVTEELDGGPPIIQAAVPIQPGDDPEQLAQRILVEEHRIYPLATRWLLEGRLQLTDTGAQLDESPLPPSGVRFDPIQYATDKPE